jgi:type I restriction enzyme M protein
LVETAELKAVISLPSGVFKPYAGVSTAILIFTKGDETQKVWFYDVQADGFSLDDKRNPTTDNDIPDLLHSYSSVVETRSFDVQPSASEKRFRVDKTDIKKNGYDLSLSKYKKIDYQPLQYETPSHLLGQLQEIESRIIKGVEKLEKMLKK